jgi:hypothetical protein
MKKELELKLVEKFPVIFADYGGDIRKTCMGWGFSCGDGWYQLIHDMCEKITELCKDDITVTALQVKEKFGGLRFYYGMEYEDDESDKKGKRTSAIHDLIAEAEDKSYETCEFCGKPGETRGGGWIRTMCDECEKEMNKE